MFLQVKHGFVLGGGSEITVYSVGIKLNFPVPCIYENVMYYIFHHLSVFLGRVRNLLPC